jgi:hypothetical protein
MYEPARFLTKVHLRKKAVRDLAAARIGWPNHIE